MSPGATGLWRQKFDLDRGTGDVLRWHTFRQRARDFPQSADNSPDRAACANEEPFILGRAIFLFVDRFRRSVSEPAEHFINPGHGVIHHVLSGSNLNPRIGV